MNDFRSSRRAIFPVALSIFLTASSSCGRDEAGRARAAVATPNASARVTREELVIFLDWYAEMRVLMQRAMEDARAVVERTTDLDERMQVTNHYRALAEPLLAREPFKESRKGAAMRAVTEAFYGVGPFNGNATFSRNEKELDRLRAAYGAEMIDSIADQQALFREKLG